MVAIGVLLLSLFAGFAVADGPTPAAESSGIVVPSSASELAALTEHARQVDLDSATDPAAAEELPHTSLERDEAEDLLLSVFPKSLEERAGVFADLEVEQFRSNHVAVVPPSAPGDEPGLLSSLLPLRTENERGNKEPVDLQLEVAGSALEPANPLVQVQIPDDLAEGIDLPESGVTIDIPGTAVRSASIVSDAAAFYPNTADDSDVTILPTPTGVETLTQLRSAAAPTTQRFELTMPPGATLKGTRDGGAVIVREGEPLIIIHAPTAVDANGDAVPVTMEPSGDALTLRADPPEDAAYPILVDPLFESYSWMNTNTTTGIYSDWRSKTTNEVAFKPGWIGTIGGQFRSGLALRSQAGAAVSPGTFMSWSYYVPRYFVDKETAGVNEAPTSYIRNITFSQVYFVLEDSPIHNHPYMIVGLWDENKGEYVSFGEHFGSQGAYNGITLPPIPNPQEVTDVKKGGFGLLTYESTSYPRQAFVGSATVEVTDNDSPAWTELGSVGEWLSTQTKEIPYVATDAGLGIHDLRIRYTAAHGGPGEGMITVGCTGTASSACPRTSSTATKPFLFDAGAIAQGENWVNLYAVDPVGHWSAVGTSKIKVDREPPELGLSGTLTEQKSWGTKQAQYSLKLDVKDGDEAVAAAATPIGYAGTGPGEIERPQGVEDDSAGNIWVTDRVNNRIVKYSPNGFYLGQITGTVGTENQVSEPRGLAISANGNIWVAETTYKRVRQYTPSGSIVSTITNAGMEAPWGVAVAPDGAIWVTDTQNDNVLQFKQDGTLIRKIRPNGSTDIPFGLDIDEYGNGWIAMQGSNRVVEMSPTGTQLFAFGSYGTEDGKFNAPFDVAIAPSGNLFVTDANNNRIQEFKPDGGFMRKFGTTGTASNQLSEPKGIAVLPGNGLAIADAANKRVAKWTHADRHIESGAVKTEVKVDGTLIDTYNPGCAAGKNCSLSREWVMKADNYSVGSHKVDVIATDAAGIKAEKSLTVETHGDLQPPAVALSGTMTEQTTLGNTRPTYKLKETATDSGSPEERKSGVASTSIKVDGTVVDSSSPGCPAGACSITREWTLNSSSYAVGTHAVEVKATDAAGRTTTKSLSLKVERDTTAPQLVLSGALPGAPEGWVQEGVRSANAEATDVAGYGVKQIRFMIDGVVAGETASQSCEAGGCGKTTTFSVNMTPYSGGAHEAVMAAEDGAGNVRKKTWAINLDPEGHISASEATDTLEALDETSPFNTVGAPAAEINYEGTADSLSFTPSSGGFVSDGSLAPTELDTATPAGLTVEVPTQDALSDCGPDPASAAEEKELTGPEEEALVPTHGCSEPVIPGLTPELVPVEVSPTVAVTSPQALANGGTAAVVPNAATNLDVVTRPLFDGAMSFMAIRDYSSQDSYSWTLHLESGQELRFVDPQQAEVRWIGGPRAFSITAIPAHDAVGTNVPTSLSVAGNVLTLKVNHRSSSFVYPVVGGAGWEGGFLTHEIVLPSGGEEPGPVEQEELEIDGELSGFWREANFGAPELAELDSEGKQTHYRAYNFTECRWDYGGNDTPEGKPPAPLPPKDRLAQDVKKNCHVNDGDPYYSLSWAVSVHGVYKYVRGGWVQDGNGPDGCPKWGPNEPAKVHCRVVSNLKVFPHLDVLGDFRFGPGRYNGAPFNECIRINGVLPNWYKQENPGEQRLEGNYHFLKYPANPGEHCPWNNLEKQF